MQCAPEEPSQSRSGEPFTGIVRFWIKLHFFGRQLSFPTALHSTERREAIGRGSRGQKKTRDSSSRVCRGREHWNGYFFTGSSMISTLVLSGGMRSVFAAKPSSACSFELFTGRSNMESVKFEM